MRRIEQSVWLGVTPEVAFDYMTAPALWRQWYPGILEIEAPECALQIGDAITEHLRTFGITGQICYLTTESTRPWRFGMESTEIEIPLMRDARVRITYTFERSNQSLGDRTRVVRTFEYEFKGLLRFLDLLFVHRHMEREGARALANLQNLLPPGTGEMTSALKNVKFLRPRPTPLQCLARFAFSAIATTLLVPLLTIVSMARALYLRLVGGRASDILRARQGAYRTGIFYRAQMVFEKPFDPLRFRQVFSEMVEEAGIDQDRARVIFEMEPPRPFPATAAVEGDHYVEHGSNWSKRGKGLRKMILWVRVFNAKPGLPTVLEAGLPGSAWDGSSCFNFMKELVSRSCGGPRADIFQGKRITLLPASARLLERSSFVGFTMRLPRDIAFNTWSVVWNLVSASRVLGGTGVSPEITLLNLDEAESARLEAGAHARGVKPFAVLAFAIVNAYRDVLGRNPYCLVQQASLQTRHYEPKFERNLVGDWLVGPLHYLSAKEFTLMEAQKAYGRLIGELDMLGDQVQRAFDAKAYALVTGAAIFQAAPTYGLKAKMWDSIWFNNYGARSVCPQAGFISWNWAAPFGLGFNAIRVNGRTCISLSSLILGISTLRAMRDSVEASLRSFMAIGTARAAADCSN